MIWAFFSLYTQVLVSQLANENVAEACLPTGSLPQTVSTTWHLYQGLWSMYLLGMIVRHGTRPNVCSSFILEGVGAPMYQWKHKDPVGS